MQTKQNYLSDEFNFIVNGGEMGNLMRSKNWSTHPMGAVLDWPQSLRTTLSIILNSKFPMFLFWGKDHICFYNDAYRPSLGINGKHPAAFGQKGKECWPEIWEFIQPLIDNAMNGKEASWNVDQLLPIERNGKLEDVYWTFSYSPVNDETGKPAGVFVTCTETTDKIKTLKAIGEAKVELEFAINSAELGTWDLNLDNNKLALNDRLKDWLGIENNKEINLNEALELIYPPDKQRISDAIANALQYSSNGNFNNDFRITNLKSGKQRTIRAKGNVLFNELKEAFRFKGIVVDITAEILIRQTIVDSENTFRKLVEQAPVAICVLKEPDFKVVVANDRMLQLWGKTGEEVMTKPVFTSFPQLIGLEFEKLLKNVYSTGEPYFANELPITLQRNGKTELVYLNFVYEAFFDNSNKIDGIMGVAIDVTEQVNARIKIEDAEERARLAADAVDLGTYDFNLISGNIIASPRALAIFGFDTQVSREALINVIHPDDKILQQNAHDTLLNSGILYYEVRVVWKDKSTHWVRVEGKLYLDDNKLPIRLLGTILDITSQKMAEGELTKTNQRLEIALEVGQLGSYELDLASGKFEVSDQFRINYGLSKVESITLDTILNLIVPAHREKVTNALADAIENRSVYNIEYQIQWADNTLHWIKSSAKARYDENLKAIIFIGVTADITEHKQLEQQKDDFLGIASHELKTPVTTIKAYNQLLETMLLEKGDVKEATLVNKMGSQVNRLTTLIGDLLDVTKINSGQLQLNNNIINFNDLVKDILDDIQNTTPKIIIEQNLLAVGNVYADKERIVQVITNLVTNAIKYSPNSNKIIIHTSLKEDEIIFCVEDFGVGISEENLLKVFEQFYRVRGNMQHTFSGLGLGLYISAEIIKRIGGKIWAKSIEGEGATFCFALPVYKENVVEFTMHSVADAQKK